MHICPMVTPGTPPVPHVGGPIIPPCSPNVITGFMPQARVTDMCVCVGPPDTIVKGSITVLVNGLQAARIGDLTVHGGSITTGYPTVLIGDVGGGGASAPSPLVLAPFLSALSNDLALIAELAKIATGLSSAIKIDGSPQFKAQALVALAKILSTPSGREWLAQMEANGQTVTIRQGGPGENTCAPLNDAAARDGTGSDSTIMWDPDTTTLDGFPPDVANCGNDTILFHEMVHGMHNANGDHRNGPTESFAGQNGGSQRGEERSTVGTSPNVPQPAAGTRPVQQQGPPPSDAPANEQTNYDGTKPGENYPTENSYRRDKGLTERPSYYPTNWPGGPPW
jgi:uncharacterized Zn-binding protein involved in type VI secretion